MWNLVSRIFTFLTQENRLWGLGTCLHVFLVKKVIKAFEQAEEKGASGGMGPSIGQVPAKKWIRDEDRDDAPHDDDIAHSEA